MFVLQPCVWGEGEGGRASYVRNDVEIRRYTEGAPGRCRACRACRAGLLGARRGVDAGVTRSNGIWDEERGRAGRTGGRGSREAPGRSIHLSSTCESSPPPAGNGLISLPLLQSWPVSAEASRRIGAGGASRSSAGVVGRYRLPKLSFQISNFFQSRTKKYRWHGGLGSKCYGAPAPAPPCLSLESAIGCQQSPRRSSQSWGPTPRLLALWRFWNITVYSLVAFYVQRWGLRGPSRLTGRVCRAASTALLGYARHSLGRSLGSANAA